MRVAVAALFALAACYPGVTGGWPAAESLYQVNGASVTCDRTSSQHGEPAGGPFTYYQCEWRGVTYQGAPACLLILEWTRASSPASAPWHQSGQYIAGADDCAG